MLLSKIFYLVELHTLRNSRRIVRVLYKKDLMGKIDKEELIEKFIFELPILRARVDMTQDEISEMIGVSRQTYSSIETKKRKMSWCQYMSLLFVFYYNPATKEAVENAGVFPEELKGLLCTDNRKR